MDYKSEKEKYKKLFETGVLTKEEFDSQKERLEREERAEDLASQKKAKGKKKLIIILIAAIAVIAVLGIVIKVVIPKEKYNKAVSLIDEGKYIESYEVLKDLNGFKDSTEKMKEIWPEVNMEKMQSAEIGDYVSFGSYPQSSSDYDEDIEWLVIDKEGDKLLLISKYVLDARPYNNPYEASKKTVDWESSWIRSWLNADFIEEAFDSFEQGHIDQTLVKGEVSSDKKTPPGKDTSDRVFLINQEELQRKRKV